MGVILLERMPAARVTFFSQLSQRLLQPARKGFAGTGYRVGVEAAVEIRIPPQRDYVA